MTFDQLVQALVDQDHSEEVNVGAAELIFEVLNVGADVLNKVPRERVSAMISLVQTATGVAASQEDEPNPVLLMFINSSVFPDALIYAFQASAGILTMEEIR